MTSVRIVDKRAIAAAKRVLSGADRVADPFATAEIFAAEAYTGEDFWQFEKFALFEREWLCVGHVNQVPNPGDHFSITVIEEPLVVTRDEAGQLHVLSAICQHRGHPLLDGLAAPASPGECSNAKLLICPYHAWSYRLDGSLLAAPQMGKTASPDAMRQRIRLPAIRHIVFHGLIFINFDAEAPSPVTALSKLDAMIAGYRIAELVPAAATSLPIASNWKLYQENSLEPYHTDVVHRNSHSAAPAQLSVFFDYQPADKAIMTATGFAGSNELFDAAASGRLPQIEGLSAEQQNQVLFAAVLPVLFLVCEPGSVLVNLALPNGPKTMTRVTFSLYPRAATELDGFAEVVAAQSKALDGIVQEDLVTQEALQRGHASRFTPKGTLSWLETTIPQMNSWLVERYRTAYAIATDLEQV